MQMTTQSAKTLVSGLRRELKARDSTVLSHSQTGELVARAFGFPTWSAFRASLPDAAPESRPVPRNGYPLKNTGQFDFARQGAFVTGYLAAGVRGSIEEIRHCTAYVQGVTRQADGSVEVEYSGDTDVNWDHQAPMQDADGAPLWDSIDGCLPQTALVIVPPDHEDGVDLDDPDVPLPVRSALIEALLEVLVDKPAAARSALAELAEGPALDSRTLGQVEATVGFAATHPERARLFATLKERIGA